MAGKRRSVTAALVAAAMLGFGCGEDPGGDAAAPPTTPAPPSSSTSITPPTTGTVVQGGLEGEDPFVRSVVGSTYRDATNVGATAHQASDFGTKGSWTLFTVEHDGHWYAFTTKNVPGEGGVGTLGDASEVVTGERLRDLRDEHWYGVEGIVRDGREIGGVMLQGRGYEREADGTFPAIDAWRVNLQTLRLEHTSIAGLDVVEPCG